MESWDGVVVWELDFEPGRSQFKSSQEAFWVTVGQSLSLAVTNLLLLVVYPCISPKGDKFSAIGLAGSCALSQARLLAPHHHQHPPPEASEHPYKTYKVQDSWGRGSIP